MSITESDGNTVGGSDFKENLVLVTSYGRSVADVCRRAGINRQQYNRYLSGQSSPSLSTLRRICDFFGLEDHEIFLDHATFTNIIRRRPPTLRAKEDPVSKFVRDITQQAPDQQKTMEKYEGYYHCYFQLEDSPRKLLRSLLSIQANGGGWESKSIEKYPSSTYMLPGKLTYKGIVFLKADRLMLLEQEVLSRQAMWTTVMYTTDFDNPDVLSGLSTGIAPENPHDIVCFRTVWKYLGKQPDLRSAIRRCGMLEDGDPSIPAYLSSATGNLSLAGPNKLTPY